MGNTAKANLVLLLAAFFWGSTFVFQKEVMAHLSPLAYSGLRFTIGALALMPLAVPRAVRLVAAEQNPAPMLRWWLAGSLISGFILFGGIGLQQYGLVWTSAGKAGFITSLYVVLVPLILRLAGQRISLGEGLGALVAVVGLYFLSFTGVMTLAPGDGLVLAGAFVWAGHVIAVGWLSPKMDSIVLGTGQALVCGLLGLFFTAVNSQWPTWEALYLSRLDIFWGSILSVTLGFTLQVVGQKNAKPAPAAIIMQLEAIVAALAGCLILHEVMSGRMLAGAFLMLAGMVLSQLWPLMAAKRKMYAKTS